jgi:hypothetical protein
MGCRPEVLAGLGSSFSGFFMDQVLILYFVAMLVANPALYLLCPPRVMLLPLTLMLNLRVHVIWTSIMQLMSSYGWG